VKAVQEQQVEIELLKAENLEMKLKILEFENLLNELKRELTKH
jgi:hypothetical protein